MVVFGLIGSFHCPAAIYRHKTVLAVVEIYILWLTFVSKKSILC